MARNLLFVVNILSILLCVAGYLLNIGWYRFLFGIILVPALIVHYIFHFSFARKGVKAKTVLYSCLSNLALVLAFVLFPDVSDTPDQYAVFRLYKDPPAFFWTVAQVSFIGSIVLTIITKLSQRVSEPKG